MAGICTVNCEWGEQGLGSAGSGADVLIVVDVLTFSTCTDVAVSRGAQIFPYEWRDSRHQEDFAREFGAELAGRRGQAKFSHSPQTFLRIEPGTRVVLPSPNGGALSSKAAAGLVLAGCFRNAAAVAKTAQAAGRKILVLPAGERWPDDSLRPALEDWLGAGAIIDSLSGDLSPEAEAARAAFRSAGKDLPRLLRNCTSGKELIGRGYGEDIELAAELNSSKTVPILRNRRYMKFE
ncbi:MAG: 2-phosphosulfolactate phosphatase [Acidobacteria bacterium]|nr:2-phosphosulfolactate phosphatase [Acidobacteriota bacterium]